ncbi:hypothetical protein FAGAP_389 [Fusarium agapanthi]|uniref:Uncharacterized protein n=1 Tax=Fusarium agapanthi TaxID=1803897 RepID=A0A9P5EH74_9HYPO|nr:hypothetical protein FAGAP_389 [Fusarium agapanthi]
MGAGSSNAIVIWISTFVATSRASTMKDTATLDVSYDDSKAENGTFNTAENVPECTNPFGSLYHLEVRIYDDASRARVFAVRTSARVLPPGVIGNKTFPRKTDDTLARATRTRSIQNYLAILPVARNTGKRMAQALTILVAAQQQPG